MLEELLGLKLKNAPVYVAEKVKELRRKIGGAAWEIQYKIRVGLNDGLLENPEQIVHLAVRSYYLLRTSADWFFSRPLKGRLAMPGN